MSNVSRATRSMKLPGTKTITSQVDIMLLRDLAAMHAVRHDQVLWHVAITALTSFGLPVLASIQLPISANQEPILRMLHSLAL